MRLPWRSPKGARGWMPLIPETAERLGVTTPGDPAHNIAGGARYLHWLLDRFDGHVTLARAGYNAGESAVKRYGGIPPYRETHDDVRRVQTIHPWGSRAVADQLAGEKR